MGGRDVAIKVEFLVKEYGDLTAVDSVSFTISMHARIMRYDVKQC